jgi:hypothetical protein
MNAKPVHLSQFVFWRGAIQALLNNHPFALLSDLSKSGAAILAFRYAGEKVYYFNEPDLVKEVLVVNHAKLKKGRGLKRAKRTFGNGLLTSEGDFHRQQRRIIQPGQQDFMQIPRRCILSGGRNLFGRSSRSTPIFRSEVVPANASAKALHGWS